MSENSLFPRRSEIFKGNIFNVRDSVARPSLDTLYQVNFSFGNYQTWLESVPNLMGPNKRSQGRDFQRKMSLLCTQAEIPGTSFETNLATGHHQGIVEEFPNIRTFPPLNLTFYCDADMVILEVLETWMSYINPIQGNKRNSSAYSRFNYPADYKEIIHVIKFEKDTFIEKGKKSANFREDPAQQALLNRQFLQSDYQSKMTAYEFVNIWPTNMTSMRVAYGDSNVLQCSVEFRYDRFFTRFNYEDPNQAIVNTPDGVVTSKDINAALPLKMIDTQLNPNGTYTNTGTSSINPFQV